MPQGDFSTVGGFGQILPNTAVLPQDATVLDTYFNVAEKQHRDKLLDYQKEKDNIDRYLKETNFDLEGIYPEDKELLDTQAAEMLDFVDKNPKALLPSLRDAESRKLNAEFENKYRTTMYNINKSKAARVRNEALMDKVLSKPDDYDVEEVTAAIKQNRAAGLERGDTEIKPKFDYNMVTVLDELAKQTGTIDNTGKAQGIGGGLVKTTTTTEYDPQEIDRLVNLAWKDDYKGTQKHFNKVYAALPETSVEKLKYKTPEEFGKATLKAGYAKIKEQKDKTQGINYAPQPNQSNTEDVTYIAENAANLSNPNSKIYESATITRKNGEKVKVAVTHTFDDIPVTVKDKDGTQYETPVSGVYNIDGKLYAVPSFKETGKGVAALEDLVPITDVKTQLIERKINSQFGSSPNKAKLSQTTFDIYDKLKGENSVPSTSESGIKWQK